jgi:nucleoid-associated protein YgaU
VSKSHLSLSILGLLFFFTSPVIAQEDLLTTVEIAEEPKKSEEDLSSPVTEEEPISSETVELDASTMTTEENELTESVNSTEIEELTSEISSTEKNELTESVNSNKKEDLTSETSSTKENEPTESANSTKAEELSSETSSTEEIEDKKEFVPAKTADDLESIMEDISPDKEASKMAEKDEAPEIKTEKNTEPEVFDVGREEKELLSLSQNIQGQITDGEWSEVATATKVSTYTVAKNDWLFKISKKLFGSGFYYPKIWSLNSFITNPHFIEPGMILSFTTGSSSEAPEVKLGSFSAEEMNASPGSTSLDPEDFRNYGDDAEPGWIDEKSRLEKQGIHFQYSSEDTLEDLTNLGEKSLNKEYENYEPPKPDFDVVLPKNYDELGFDKNSRIFYSIREGFYLSTFLSTNIVQDFGSITDGLDTNTIFDKTDRAYASFDDTMNLLPGDKFSVYSSGGKISQTNSDREGYQYSILGQIQLIRKIRNKWEIEFLDVSGTPKRGDRITTYTPKIERITKTYNSRTIEAGIMSSFEANQSIISFGDVVYLDRGRADGVEMGNVFEVYGFKDRVTNRNITDQPTYKVGELTVITLTDNFSTAIVSDSTRDFYAGDLAITKSKEAYLSQLKTKITRSKGIKDPLGGRALEELDVELNLENLNEDLLKEADKIRLTEDELAELERQEREKSVIKDSETDLKALERLEGEIEQAEAILKDAKLDEDKLLEQENLEDMEKKNKNNDQESLEEIEENLGKRYLDEELNSKDNPYGLTEYDVEEIDELLNIEKKTQKDE